MRARPLVGLLLATCSTGVTPIASPDDGSAALDLGNPCPAPDGGDLPCPVAAVLAARCQPCHQRPPRHHAPWPLLSYENLTQPFGITSLHKWQRMAQVIEPGAQPHMPPARQPQLDDQQLELLRVWFRACAPPLLEGTGCDLEDGGSFAGFDLPADDGGVADASAGVD